MKTCPHCLSTIESDVSCCPNCGKKTDINSEVENLINKMENKSTKNIFKNIGNGIGGFLFFLVEAIKYIFIAVIVICVICFIGGLIF